MRATPSNDPKHFDSDRDVLPFPIGGVFAGQARPLSSESDDGVASVKDVAANIEEHLAAMQRNIDALAEALDDPIPFSTLRTPSDDDYSPAA